MNMIKEISPPAIIGFVTNVSHKNPSEHLNYIRGFEERQGRLSYAGKNSNDDCFDGNKCRIIEWM